jgi:hypothetical protein
MGGTALSIAAAGRCSVIGSSDFTVGVALGVSDFFLVLARNPTRLGLYTFLR